MDAELQHIIDERTNPWGITVQSVEIRDVIIPTDFEDAMNRQAPVLLGESKKQIAASFYTNNPRDKHLRAMNMSYEGLKEKGALVIFPSSVINTMYLVALCGIVSLRQ